MIKTLFFPLALTFASLGHAEITEIPIRNTCKADYVTLIDSKNNQCLRMISDQSTSHPEELVIYLHGDYGVGGSGYMSKIAAHLKKSNRLNIALIRPGYFDDEGHFSTGSSLGVTTTQIAGRLDNYTKENIELIGQAIQNLKSHYKPKRLLIIGHSGGAAIGALLLNEFPHLSDGALLINCPCDIKRWRPDWQKSLSPIEHINHIPHNALIWLLAGADDDVVWPELSKAYAEQLENNGIHAQFFLALGMGHNLNDKEAQVMTLKTINTFLTKVGQP